jgi:hypothetical protein
MFPTDRLVLESLNVDYLFDWMSNLTNQPARDIWDMYFMVDEEVKDRYNEWWERMYHGEQCGSLWRRIRAIPARYKRGIPIWD